MAGVRTIAEVALGLLLAAGAVFNSTYTLRNGSEFYGSFSEGAWLPKVGELIDEIVIPNAALVTVGVVLVGSSAAAMILTRGGLVTAGLVLGSVFALTAAAASSPVGTIANVVLAALMAGLALSR